MAAARKWSGPSGAANGGETRPGVGRRRGRPRGRGARRGGRPSRRHRHPRTVSGRDPGSGRRRAPLCSPLPRLTSGGASAARLSAPALPARGPVRPPPFPPVPGGRCRPLHGASLPLQTAGPPPFPAHLRGERRGERGSPAGGTGKRGGRYRALLPLSYWRAKPGRPPLGIDIWGGAGGAMRSLLWVVGFNPVPVIDVRALFLPLCSLRFRPRAALGPQRAGRGAAAALGTAPGGRRR